MSKASSWIRVAQGFQMVAQAASKIALEEGNNIASTASKHGFDLVKNARNATSHFASSMENIDHQNFYHNDAQLEQERTVNLNIKNVDKGNGKPMRERDDKSNLSRVDKVEEIIYHSNTSSNEKQQEESQRMQYSSNSSNKPQQPLHLNIDNESIKTNHQKHLTDKDHNFPQDYSNNNHRLKEGKAVPSTRIGRAFGFAQLGVGLAVGTAFELVTRVASRVTNDETTSKGSLVTNDANSDRLARTLCRMRGAALKLGQMLSIQDETLLAPPLAKALEQVRQGADAMPLYQLQAKMKAELGEDWKSKFVSFEEYPFAAASIGQVHRAIISTTDEEGQNIERKVVVKCQYPGVANSIDSDLNNLSMIVKMTGLTPPGLFIDNVIRVGRDELAVECNYLLEAENQERFRKLVENDKHLSQEKFKVPAVITDLSTQHVITSEFCPGGTIDKVSFLDQNERNRIAKNILRLTMKELFSWRFMQTDPNWGNFLYDVGTGTTYLIDFGSAREYSKSFVDGYLRIVWANANRDTETLMSQSIKMGFLTGEENDIMMNAHKMSGFTVGEPFSTNEEYDFVRSGITGRMSEHATPFLQHRLTPPPEEVYTLHRKLAGAYNLCIKLGAKVQCRDLLEDIMNEHVFEDGEDHPLH